MISNFFKNGDLVLTTMDKQGWVPELIRMARSKVEQSEKDIEDADEKLRDIEKQITDRGSVQKGHVYLV